MACLLGAGLFRCSAGQHGGFCICKRKGGRQGRASLWPLGRMPDSPLGIQAQDGMWCLFPGLPGLCHFASGARTLLTNLRSGLPWCSRKGKPVASYCNPCTRNVSRYQLGTLNRLILSACTTKIRVKMPKNEPTLPLYHIFPASEKLIYLQECILMIMQK